MCYRRPSPVRIELIGIAFHFTRSAKAVDEVVRSTQ